MIKSIFYISRLVLNLPRISKLLIVLSVDACLCISTVWFSFYLRLGEFVPFSQISPWPMFSSLVIALPIFMYFGLYREIFRYGGWMALRSVVKAVLVYAIFFITIFTVVGVQSVPRTIGIIQPIFFLFFVSGVRAFASAFFGEEYRNILKYTSRPRALIYGAGRSGRQLVHAINNSPDIQIVGFLDDDKSLQNQAINGLRIYNPKDLVEIVQSQKISRIVLAMPNISRHRRNHIIEKVRVARVLVLTMPNLKDMLRDESKLLSLRELEIDDLLGREQIDPNPTLMSKNISGKVVMVTGAGGSIGSELCFQIMNNKPARLLLLDNSEFALYSIHQKIEELLEVGIVEVIPFLGSVQNVEYINELMKIWRPDTVYHAAAYKHVPLVEHNVSESIRNNVFGTLNTVKAAIENGVSDFVLISSDKAVRPTNIMGATKRIAEEILQALSESNKTTTLSMVRFGNVLDSSGSVVPKFRQQIHNGGPITLTHIEVTRYFMTISEAAQLVIHAGAMANGGEVFVLDMGPPIKIIDLAKRMVELAGLTLKDDCNVDDGQIEIKVTGLRPGEKLYEEMLIADNPMPTNHKKIMKARDDFNSWCILEKKLNQLLEVVAMNDITKILEVLGDLVPSYKFNGEIVDWRYAETHNKIQLK